MSYLLSIFSLSLLLSATNDISPSLKSFKSNSNSHSVHIIGFMVNFQLEESDWNESDPKTTGNGNFLLDTPSTYTNYYNSSVSKCSGFLIDPPPHNKTYFEDQIVAVKNYYNNISQGQINFNFELITSSSEDGTFTVDHNMVYYSELASYDEPEEGIVTLFSDGLDKAKDAIEEYLIEEGIFDENEMITQDDVLFVMFHAGVGEDYGFDGYIDPANYDIRSAYIDEDMADFTPEGSWMEQKEIRKGILLPEGLNLIYYPTIEDIYGNAGEDGLCDVQVGMTGLFAYLLGYEFGLPEMFDTESGQTGIGKFGLMDIGSFNFKGLIPSPPQAWSRYKMGWETTQTLDETSSSNYLISQRYSSQSDSYIPRINLNQSEYYLLETVNNRIFNDYGIPDIQCYLDPDTDECDSFLASGLEIPKSIIPLFDRLLYLDQLNDCNSMDRNIISYQSECDPYSRMTLSPETKVILCLDSYDYGFPGSGMMIWHINENNEDNFNNDINNRTVKLVEADGAQDIGFENYMWPQANPSVGWKWDLWFDDNLAYYNSNPGQEPLHEITLSSFTIPSTHDHDGARSYIYLEDIGVNSLDNHIAIDFNLFLENDLFSQDFLNNNSQQESQNIEILGAGINNDDEYVIILADEVLTKFSYNDGSDEIEAQEIQVDLLKDFIVISGEEFISCESTQYFFNGSCESLEDYIPKGYFNNFDYVLDDIPENFRDIDPYNLAIGDIDQDGVDEILELTDLKINCFNPNGSSCNGFPISGNYHHNILIADVLGDSHPQILVREDDGIHIISYLGETIHKISSNFSMDIHIVPGWDYRFALVDGNRMLKFSQNNKKLGYWLNPRGLHTNEPRVNENITPNYSDIDFSSNIDVFYNYPNPISDGVTSFRYFIGSADRIEIKIYTASGFFVDKLESNLIHKNEYNEEIWYSKDNPPGLYLANLIAYSGSTQSDSKIIKVLITTDK